MRASNMQNDNSLQPFFDKCSLDNHVNTNERQDILISNQRLQDINPLIAGQQICTSGHEYGPQVRSYYLLHYIVSGKGVFISDGKQKEVVKGQIFVISPNQETWYKADNINPWHYRWIGFTSSLDLSSILTNDVVTAPECDYLFRLIAESNHIQYLKEYYICGKLYEILTLLAQKSNVGKNKTQQYAMIAKNYIEINYSDVDFRITTLADKLNLDRSYLAAIFKKHMKKSPQQYLQDIRLTKAAELLSYSQYTISEIATSCGYSDIYNFSRMFKRKFHIAPSQYGLISDPSIKKQT